MFVKLKLGDTENLGVQRNPFIATSDIEPGVINAYRFPPVEELDCSGFERGFDHRISLSKPGPYHPIVHPFFLFTA